MPLITLIIKVMVMSLTITRAISYAIFLIETLNRILVTVRTIKTINRIHYGLVI